MDKKVLDISWLSLWRILLFLSLVSVLFMGRKILLGLFLAIIISSGLEVVVDFLERRGLPRALGVITIFLLFLFLLILVVYTIVPLIIVDLGSVFSGFSRSTAGSIFGSLVNIDSYRSVEELVDKITKGLFSGDISPLGIFSKTLGNFGLAIAVLISSFYLSLSRDGVERFITAVFPDNYEKAALRVYERSRRKIGFWFRTQILLSVIIGLSVWGTLAILGVKHPFLLGVVAGIFEIVPFVGPILSGAAAVLVAMSVSLTLAVYTLIAFLAIQQLESHILVPILLGRTIGLHPVIVIISLLIGAEISGLLGVLIAVPAAAVFVEVIEEWSGKKKAAASSP
ncbi:MAG: AI-2E family transporter [Patescibacteria group bacterium]